MSVCSPPPLKHRGATTPLPCPSKERVVQLLKHAQNASTQAAVELDALCTRGAAGSKVLLLELCTCKGGVDESLRLLCAIQFKNACVRNWNVRSTNQHDIQERNVVKERIISAIPQEDNSRILAQYAESAAKIARKEWPRQWGNLLDQLAALVQNTSSVVMHRGLIVLECVLEQLSQKRLLSDRRNFEKASHAMLGFIHNMWQHHLSAFLTAVHDLVQKRQNPDAQTTEKLRFLSSVSLLSSKCIKHIIVYGTPSPNKSPEACALIPKLLESMKALHVTYPHVHNSTLQEPISDILSCLTQTILSAQKNNALAFRPFLLPCLEVFYTVVMESGTKNDSQVYEQFVVDSFSFLSAVVSCAQYHGNQGASFSATAGLEFNEDTVKEAQAVLSGFFTAERVQSLGECLVTVYFPLTAADMEEWQTDGEQFYTDSLIVRYDEKKRPAAEHLFSTLLAHFSAQLSPAVVNMLQHVSKPLPTNFPEPPVGSGEYQNLRLKEAVYNAFGLCVPVDVSDALKKANFDFNHLHQSILVHDIHNQGTGILLTLRRRVAWLIGQCVEYTCSTDKDTVSRRRKPLFQTLFHLLSDKDLVVRLEAARSLGFCVDIRDFFPDHFQELLCEACAKLLKLIGDCSDLNVRVSVMNVVSTIVDRLGHQIRPAASTIVNALPPLWEGCEDQNLLRNSIVTTLCHLVKALQFDSVKLYSFLFPVLAFCLDKSVADRGFLVEVGFELWLTVVQNAPQLTKELADLFNVWLQHNEEMNSEILESSMRLLSSYCLLGKESFLLNHVAGIRGVLQRLLNEMSEKGLERYLMPSLQTMAELFPSLLCKEECLGSILGWMVRQLLESKQKASLLICYIDLFSRLFFESFDDNLRLLATLSQHANTDLRLPFLEAWLSRFDGIQMVYKKKLSALALCRFITGLAQGKEVELLSRVFPAIVTVSTQVVSQERLDDQLGGALPTFEAPSCAAHEWTEIRRMELLCSQDQAPKQSLKDALSQQIHGLRSVLGHDVVAKLLSSVDGKIMQALQ